jgi:sugar phosphate isomerase/epimerase
MRLRFGYVTNGLAHHRLDDALRLLADLGYDGCAVTLDHGHLDPFGRGLAAEVARVAALASQLGLALGVETGARFLLDPRRKHEPTLLSEEAEGRARRVDFLRRAVAIARDLGAPVVSIWSGAAPAGVPTPALRERLASGVEAVLRAAEAGGVTVGVEPEPGMMVGLADEVRELREHLEVRGNVDASRLGLTLDLGHCLVNEGEAPEALVRRHARSLVNVHAEDMRRGRHEHLAFGEGEMVYPPILAALRAAGYAGLVNVELSRDSHRAPEVAAAALAYLRAAEAEAAA